MPTIVYQTNPKNGVKYAYESVSYWDKDKKAPRSKRRYLGRVDPETGEIIKGRHNHPKTGLRDPRATTGDKADAALCLTEELAVKDAEITALKKELADMASRYEEAVRMIAQIHSLSGSFTSGR